MQSSAVAVALKVFLPSHSHHGISMTERYFCRKVAGLIHAQICAALITTRATAPVLLLSLNRGGDEQTSKTITWNLTDFCEELCGIYYCKEKHEKVPFSCWMKSSCKKRKKRGTFSINPKKWINCKMTIAKKKKKQYPFLPWCSNLGAKLCKYKYS